MTIAFIVNKSSKVPYLCKQEGTKGGPIGRGKTIDRAFALFLEKLSKPVEHVKLGKVQYL